MRVERGWSAGGAMGPRGVSLRVAHGKLGPELTAPFTQPQASGPSALRVMTHLSLIRIAGIPGDDVP